MIWLNEKPAKAIEIKTQIEGTSYQELQQVVFPTYIQPMLVKGAYYVRFLNELGIDNTNHRRFLYDHTDILEQLKAYADNNRINRVISLEAKNKAKSAIEILSLPELSLNNTPNTFKNRILKMANHLKQWGNPEDEIFADYIEGITQDFNQMTVGDVYDIYKLTRTQVHNLTKNYLTSIIVPVAEAAYPFVVYALTEATLGAALPLISRIPVVAVIQTNRLYNMVKKIALLGIRAPGARTNIRIVTVNGSAYSKALEIFKMLTKNVTPTIQSNGTRIANLGNGNSIIFRPASGSDFVATLELNFPSIWNRVRILKFN